MSDIQGAAREAQRSGCAGMAILLIVLGAILLTSDRCQGPTAPVPSPSATVVTR
jgi:hypothetical protein